MPLVQIKSMVELLGATSLKAEQKKLVSSLGLSTDVSLRLIEAYRLALSLNQNTQLPLEPVAIGAVLSDVAHQLTPLAKRYDVELWLDVQPNLQPALAHQPSLATAMDCLGSSLIRAQASASGRHKGRLLLGAHKHPEGEIITGIFSSAGGVSQQALRAARHLSGRARQPIPEVPAGTASGVLVADMLCAKIWRPLMASRHNRLEGLATLVPVSKQLNLV